MSSAFITQTLSLWGLSREATRSIWTTRTQKGGQFLFHMSLPQDAAAATNAYSLG